MITGFGSILKDYLEYYHISQAEFADRLDISRKHLNEIINKNTDISDELIVAISLITDIPVKDIVILENNKKIKRYLQKEYGNNLKEYLKKFNINELIKRNWLQVKNKDDLYQTTIDLFSFLKIRNFNAMNNILNNIMYKKKEDADDIKILLWISRCNILSDKQLVKPYKKENINKLLTKLKIERNNKYNYQNLIKIFNELGFYLVIEDSLPGTKIRGCCKVKNNNPAIYLTKTYKNKSSLYFALYHEIGHLKRSYNQAKNKYIIESDNKLEQLADEFSLNEMLNNNLLNEIITSNNLEKSSILISKRENIPISFITSILAYNKYIKYTSSFYINNQEYID